MAYGSTANVKLLYLPEISGTGQDSAIDGLRAVASRIIDNNLRAFETVPLGTVPSEIDDIANLWTAGAYRAANSPDGKHAFMSLAIDLLMQYLFGKYGTKEAKLKTFGGTGQIRGKTS